MNKSIYMKKFGFIASGIVAVVILIFSLKVGAQSTSIALSGSCGVVFNLTNPAQALREYSMNSVDDESLNALGHLNFDAMRASFTITSMVVSGSNTNLVERPVVNAEIRVADSTAIPGAKIITVLNGAQNIIFNLLPVNSGGTYLIQGVTFGATGVCQKI